MSYLMEKTDYEGDAVNPEEDKKCTHPDRIVTSRGRSANGQKIQNWKCLTCKDTWRSPR